MAFETTKRETVMIEAECPPEMIPTLDAGSFQVVEVTMDRDGGRPSKEITMELEGLVHDVDIETSEPEREPHHYTIDDRTEVSALEDRIREELALEGPPTEMRLVLGEPQVKLLESHIEEYDTAPDSIEDWFGVTEVIEVPGPMIHCPR